MAKLYNHNKGNSVYVTALDLTSLLYNCIEGSRINEIGYQDTERFYADLLMEASRTGIRISFETLESLLWSANMMDEVNLFWDSRNRKFDTLVRDILNRNGHKDYQFNKTYNWIERKK